MTVLAANGLVSSLDYCNSLFRGYSCFSQHILQSIQNILARIVTNHRKYAHVTPILKQFYWLPAVKYRCMFKTATLLYIFYCVNTSYPMDNCFTGRRDRSRQTPEKDVLYIILAGPVSSVHSLGGASYLLPVPTK